MAIKNSAGEKISPKDYARNYIYEMLENAAPDKKFSDDFFRELTEREQDLSYTQFLKLRNRIVKMLKVKPSDGISGSKEVDTQD